MPTLRLQWDASTATTPINVGSLHLLVRASGATSGARTGAKGASTKDTVSGHCSLALSALREAAHASASQMMQRTCDEAGRETELVLKVKDFPLVSEGRPVMYPPGSADQLLIDVTIRVYR